jgi:mannose-6-phosphate isomerase-like protein (cupin superfamily)
MPLDVRTIDVAEATFSVDKLSKSNVFETGRFFLDVYGLLPGQEQKPHLHDGNDKVYLCMDGSVAVTVGEESGRLRKGQAVLAPAGERHSVKNDGPHRAVLLVFMAPNPNVA